MNTTFAKSLDAFVSAERKGGSAFGTLVTYSQEYITLQRMEQPEVKNEVLANVLKNAIDKDESEYKAAHPKMDAMPTAYRSAKSVILAAVKAGISLYDEDGKPMGKSALEKLTAEGKPEKAAIVKFQTTMTTASSIFASITDLKDIVAAKELVRQLADQVLKAEAERMPKAA